MNEFDDNVIMTPDVCMRFLVWAYYYHNLMPSPTGTFAQCGKFTPADAHRLDQLTTLLYRTFTPDSVQRACVQFDMAKARNEPCPFTQMELDAMFAAEITPSVER